MVGSNDISFWDLEPIFRSYALLLSGARYHPSLKPLTNLAASLSLQRPILWSQCATTWETSNGKRWFQTVVISNDGGETVVSRLFPVFTYISHKKNQLKVGKYTIHGWYAVGQGVFFSGCVWRGTLGFNNHSNSGRYRDTVEISQQKWKDMRPCCWNHNVPFHSAPIEDIDEKRLLMRRSTQANFIPQKTKCTMNLPHKHHFKRVKQTSKQSSPETQMITVLSLPVPLLTIKP